MVALRRAGGCAPLQPALSSFAAGLEGAWSEARRAEEGSPGWLQRSPRDVGEGWACGWPWQRPSTPSKADGRRQRWAPAAEGEDDEAGSLLPAHAAGLRTEGDETLEAAVRSASLVETLHAALRPRLATCRGQGAQARLARCA